MSINKYIVEYYKEGNNIVTLDSDNKRNEIPNTIENETKILKQMKSDYKRLISSDKYCCCTDYNNIYKHCSIVTALTVIAASYLIIKNTIDSSIIFSLPYKEYVITSIMFFYSSVIYYKTKVLSNIKEKYRLFFKNEKIINKMLHKHSSFVNELNKEAKKEISDNVFDYLDSSINPINVNTLRLIKLKELKVMLNEIKKYQDSIQENDSDTLKEETNSRKLIYKNSNS